MDIERLLQIAAHYQPFVPYAMLLIAIGGIMRAFFKNNRAARWRYWPWVTLAIIATVIAWLPYVLAGSRKLESSTPWFEDDSVKWKLAKLLRGDIQQRAHLPNADACHAVILHYPTPASQEAAGAINDMLSFAGCEADDVLADRTLDDGIEVRIGRHGANPADAEFLTQRMHDKAGVVIPTSFVDQPGKGTPEMNNCWNGAIADYSCFVLLIGNQP